MSLHAQAVLLQGYGSRSVQVTQGYGEPALFGPPPVFAPGRGTAQAPQGRGRAQQPQPHGSMIPPRGQGRLY